VKRKLLFSGVSFEFFDNVKGDCEDFSLVLNKLCVIWREFLQFACAAAAGDSMVEKYD